MAPDSAANERARLLIRQLRDPTLPDESADALLTELERLLGYPRVSDLLFNSDPELSDDEMVEKALEYKPFAL
ncbi:hypothetical protein Rhe02_35680 [Rhizocola hellebori]|uniref:E9imm peptide n=2 Tax=Rhizocola hellebori TaxID=1392758 RepID=A0A8J3VGZ6_9ACTN|nr:hypothetical protein Rhe02_35680 [Rhizocola hellebori]